jgi:RHS repeat-associated protein
MDASAYSGMSRVDYVHDGMLARSHGYNTGTGAWSTHNFYHADRNGNITYLVNASQTLAASYKYDPFGKANFSSGTFSSLNTYRFSSKECHDRWGLYFLGFRWYNPYLQRWLNRDPIGELGGMNLFTFVNNSPVNTIDRLGLDDFSSCAKAAHQELDVCMNAAKSAHKATQRAIDDAAEACRGDSERGLWWIISLGYDKFVCNQAADLFTTAIRPFRSQLQQIVTWHILRWSRTVARTARYLLLFHNC